MQERMEQQLGEEFEGLSSASGEARCRGIQSAYLSKKACQLDQGCNWLRHLTAQKFLGWARKFGLSEEKAQAAPGHCQVPDMAAADAATSSATPAASSYMADAAPSPALSTGCAGGSSGGSSQRKDSASWHSILGDDRPMRGKRNDKSNAACPDAPSAGSWSSWASVSADFHSESN